MARNRTTGETQPARASARKPAGDRPPRPAADDLAGRYRFIVEAAPIGFVVISSDGSIQLVNTEVEKLFGYRREELLGQPIEMLVPPRFRTNHPGHRTGFFAAPQARTMGAQEDCCTQSRRGGWESRPI